MTAASRSMVRRVVGVLFWLVVTAVVVAALSVVCGRRLYDRLDEEIRLRAESHLRRQFPGLQVSVGVRGR